MVCVVFSIGLHGLLSENCDLVMMMIDKMEGLGTLFLTVKHAFVNMLSKVDVVRCGRVDLMW